MSQATFLSIDRPDFDFSGPEILAAQQENWYAPTSVGVIVLRYAEVQELMHDTRLRHSAQGVAQLNGITHGAAHDWFSDLIIFKYGSDHARIRRLVSKVFTPHRVDLLRPYMREVTTELLREITPDTDYEFMANFADQLPSRIMARLLGTPDSWYAQFRAWSNDIGMVFNLGVGDQQARIDEAVNGLHDYVDTPIDSARPTDESGLVSALVTEQRTEDARITRAELRNLIVGLIFAGHDTTRNQLGQAIATFCEHPDQWNELGRHPELAAQAVEEIMRWCPTVPAVFRFATEDISYQGLDIPAGTFVMLGVRAAHRDPRAFPGGDTFDITVPRTTQQLTFGGGPHFCLGAALARAELSEALPALADALPAPRSTATPQWRPPLGIAGPQVLPIRFASS